MRKINKGFSLTEIIITVAIIAILASISGPIYNSYSTKSKQAEGYLLLGTIKDAQMRWHNDTGYFLKEGGDTCYHEIFGIDARANKYYTKFNVYTAVMNHVNGYQFGSVAYGNGASNVTMIYDTNSGTTIK